MNVTKEIQKNHIIYGASDFTAPSGLAASKSLNYAKGASMQKAMMAEVTVIPHTLHYQDSVGLFGVENYFVRVDLDITADLAKACFEEIGWECAFIDPIFNDMDPYYGGSNMATIDLDKDTSVVNDYYPADMIENKLPRLPEGYVSIDLMNIKTNNKFLDDWLDIRLYTAERQEHPYDRMYVKGRDHFYIGVHARNTKRLPYNIMCVIGREYRTYESINEKKFVMRRALR